MTDSVKNTSAGTAPPSSGEASLTLRLRQQLRSSSKNSQRIAQYLLQDPYQASRLTIVDLSEATGASQATIIRFARALGLHGYPELRLALASLHDAPQDQRLTQDIGIHDDPSDVVDKLLHDESNALRHTADLIDVEALGALAGKILHAPRTMVFGIGASGLVARDLSSKLERIGLVSHAYTELHESLTSVVFSSDQDVVVAFSHSGTTNAIVDVLSAARKNLPHVVVVTSNPESAAASLSHQVVRTVSGNENFIRAAAFSSRISQLFIVDALFALVAQQRLATHRNALEAAHLALAAHHSARPANRPNRPNRPPTHPRKDNA